MAGHFLGSGADAGEGMHSAVQYFKGIADYGDVAQVYVGLAAQHSHRLHGEEQVVVHSALAHDLLDDNHLLLVGMTLLLKGLGGDNQTLVQLLQSNAISWVMMSVAWCAARGPGRVILVFSLIVI